MTAPNDEGRPRQDRPSTITTTTLPAYRPPLPSRANRTARRERLAGIIRGIVVAEARAELEQDATPEDAAAVAWRRVAEDIAVARAIAEESLRTVLSGEGRA